MVKKGKLTSVVFCVFLAGLLVWHIGLPDKDRSETENRTLAQFPEFSWENLKNGSFTQGMEDYFADQFPLRDDWTGLKARCEQLLGKRAFNGVYLCGDTLIARVEEPDETQVEKNLSYVNKFAELTGGRVLLGLIPSAAEVWQDKLPHGAPSFDQAAFIRRAAEETGLPTVDFLGALSEHADEPIYYRTDHHWTTRGAFYGSNALLEALEKLGVSKGAELRSLGPQGEPPAELVRAFEDALRAPDGQGGPSVQGVAEGSREHGPFEEAGQDIPEVTRTDEAIPPNPSEDPVYGISEGSRIDGIGGTMRIESSSGPQAVEGRTDAVQTDGMQELARLLERVGGGNASATELYQLQFLVGMLRVQATGGAKLSQQVNQGFESLLKQQG